MKERTLTYLAPFIFSQLPCLPSIFFPSAPSLPPAPCRLETALPQCCQFICIPKRMVFCVARSAARSATTTGLHRFMGQKEKERDGLRILSASGGKGSNWTVSQRSRGRRRRQRDGIRSNRKDVLSLLIVRCKIYNISSGGGGWLSIVRKQTMDRKI